MKRLSIALMTFGLLAGAGSTMLAWNSGAKPLSSPPGIREQVQIEGFPIPEPASIVLSSLALLGGTTLLRRRRVDRGA